uniref:Ubiquitin-like protease family profile domain-containing protein n=1 Tax=Kalanchoe fedtschenkoi TaxID=63787 RepID=A0A7N0UYN0_KALFE
MRRSSRIRQKEGAAAVKSIVTIDLSERQNGFNYIEASKHRSCWVHILAVPRRGRSKRRVKTGPKGKLNTTTFHTYFRSMWDRYSEDKKASFAYLDCLWFSLYYDPASRQKVLLWIKKEAIFSKAYVIVPIVLWGHWNLLILCHFDQNTESSTRRPCMLLLDSLENTGPRRYETEIRKFVFDVFQAMGRSETKKMLSKIPFVVPKVPQQIDDKECGKFVLYFIHLFMNNSPEVFEAPNGYPNFINEKWFDRGGYEDFCNQLITGL